MRGKGGWGTFKDWVVAVIFDGLYIEEQGGGVVEMDVLKMLEPSQAP